MKISKKTDLAIRILKYLVDKQSLDFISANIIARDLNISYNHLRRIIPLLNQLGFIESKLGKDGGIKLKQKSFSIPLSTLIKITEVNDTCINDCTNCIFNRNCHFEEHTNNALNLFCEYFDHIYLSDL